MDISDSQGFQKHENLANNYLQHAHYVAASQVTLLKGLQIITLNPHLINVNSDVKEHIAYMQKEKELKLCYIPTYNVPPGLKCVFLNMSSLHKHIANVKANFNICANILAETKLTKNDSTSEYIIPDFQEPYRNDQTSHVLSRPPHGIISYIRNTVKVIEKQKWTSLIFEGIILCVQHTLFPIPIQLIGLYIAPQCKYTIFTICFDQLMTDVDYTSTIIIMNDFNMKSITGLTDDYNKSVEKYMKNKYNLDHIVNENATNYNSKLDLCFMNITLKYSII